ERAEEARAKSRAAEESTARAKAKAHRREGGGGGGDGGSVGRRSPGGGDSATDRAGTSFRAAATASRPRERVERQPLLWSLFFLSWLRPSPYDERRAAPRARREPTSSLELFLLLQAPPFAR